MRRLTGALAALAAAALVVAGLGSAAPASAAVPTTTPVFTAPLDGATVSGTVEITVSTTAAAVLLYGPWNGYVSLTPVAGVATYSWRSWGQMNGPTTLTARDCTAQGECAAAVDLASIGVIVANEAPVLTAPSDGASLSGLVTFSASAPEGGIAFLVGGVQVAYDGTAPYSAVVDVALAPQGARAVTAARCTTVNVCGGAVSAPANVVIASLDLTLSRQLNPYFSPNGDGVKDTTSVLLTLPQTQAVTWWVMARDDTTVVRGPVPLGVLAKGAHRITWDGRTNAGTRPPDERYRIIVRTKAGALRGLARASTVIDTVRPKLLDLSLTGATIYPVKDGYHDTYLPPARPTESSTVRFTVSTSAGTVVHRGSVTGPYRWNVMAWNGRYPSGTLRPVGTYVWRYTSTDFAGNTWTSPRGSVRLSHRRIVHVTTMTTVDASTGTVTSTAPCAATVPSSYGSVGLRLSNSCVGAVDGQQSVEAEYRVVLPPCTGTCIGYRTATLKVYGRTVSGASTYGWLTDWSKWEGDFRLTKNLTITSGSSAWYTYSSGSAVYTNDVALVGVGVRTGAAGPDVLDVKRVQVVAYSDVLR